MLAKCLINMRIGGRLRNSGRPQILSELGCANCEHDVVLLMFSRASCSLEARLLDLSLSHRAQPSL